MRLEATALSDEPVQAGTPADAFDRVNARNLRKECCGGIFPTDPVAVRNDQLEPLFVVDDFAGTVMPPQHLGRHVTQALAAQLLGEVDQRELILHFENLAKFPDGSCVSLGLSQRLRRKLGMVIAAGLALVVTLKKGLTLGRCHRFELRRELDRGLRHGERVGRLSDSSMLAQLAASGNGSLVETSFERRLERRSWELVPPAGPASWLSPSEALSTLTSRWSSDSGGHMASGKTGKAAASAAGKTLGSKTASKAAKSAAASDLAQVGNSKVTGAKAASAAGKTLGSKGASKAAKSGAASDLAQRGRKKS
jgi:hypothetical protein